MTNPEKLLAEVRTICLAFPEAEETEKWGKPHFCVREKIFAGCGEENGNLVLGFKLEMSHAKALVQSPGFRKAPYAGHKGWVSMDATAIGDWKMVAELVEESYRLIAPRKLVAMLEATPASRRPAKPRKKK